MFCSQQPQTPKPNTNECPPAAFTRVAGCGAEEETSRAGIMLLRGLRRRAGAAPRSLFWPNEKPLSVSGGLRIELICNADVGVVLDDRASVLRTAVQRALGSGSWETSWQARAGLADLRAAVAAGGDEAALVHAYQGLHRRILPGLVDSAAAAGSSDLRLLPGVVEAGRALREDMCFVWTASAVGHPGTARRLFVHARTLGYVSHGLVVAAAGSSALAGCMSGAGRHLWKLERRRPSSGHDCRGPVAVPGWATVAVESTDVGVREARPPGVWCVAVTDTSPLLPPGSTAPADRRQVADRLLRAGAHVVIPGYAQVPHAVGHLERLLQSAATSGGAPAAAPACSCIRCRWRQSSSLLGGLPSETRGFVW